MSTENTTSKKYVSLNRLSDFLDNLRRVFATKEEIDDKADSAHNHVINDITDFEQTLDTINNTINNKTAAAGSNFGTVMSGGNVEISNGIITVKDDEHNHIIDNIDGLNEALNNKVNVDTFSSHNHNDIYYMRNEIDEKVSTLNTSIDNIISGDITVAKSTDSINSENATSAENALKDANGNIITEIYETKSEVSSKFNNLSSTLESDYYTKTNIDDMSFITTDDINTICGVNIVAAREVTY